MSCANLFANGEVEYAPNVVGRFFPRGDDFCTVWAWTQRYHSKYEFVHNLVDGKILNFYRSLLKHLLMNYQQDMENIFMGTNTFICLKQILKIKKI